jgi:hypothetical protein
MVRNGIPSGVSVGTGELIEEQGHLFVLGGVLRPIEMRRRQNDLGSLHAPISGTHARTLQPSGKPILLRASSRSPHLRRVSEQ